MAEEKSAKYLAKIFMDATDAIIVENLEGEVIDANQAAEKAYGWSRDELIGKPIKQVVPDSRYAHADELLQRCVAGELVKDVETERVTRAGDTVWVLLTLSLLTDLDGEAVAIASYAKDITRLKGEAAARDRMATVFMDATDAIIIEDLEGVVLDVNHAAEEAYGWSRDELIGKPIKKIIPEFRHESADELLQRCVAGGDVRNVEVVRVGRSGFAFQASGTKLVPSVRLVGLLTDD
jgi:PAS domain S-box-containing protein